MKTARPSKRKGIEFPQPDNILPRSETHTEYLKQWCQKLSFCSLVAALPAILAAGTQAQDEQPGSALVPKARTSERLAGFGMRKRKLALPPFFSQTGINRQSRQTGQMS